MFPNSQAVVEDVRTGIINNNPLFFIKSTRHSN